MIRTALFSLFVCSALAMTGQLAINRSIRSLSRSEISLQEKYDNLIDTVDQLLFQHGIEPAQRVRGRREWEV